MLRPSDGKMYASAGDAPVSTAVGKTVTYVDIPDEALSQALRGMGMDPWQADGLVELYAHHRRGEAARVSTGVKDTTGREPRRFADFAPAFA